MSLINQGSVDDIRSSLRCTPDAYSIKYLKAQVAEEKKARNRASVKSLLESTIKRKWKALTGKALFDHYPKEDWDRKYYVRYPNLNDNGKWQAVNVALPSGYIVLPTSREFDVQIECARCCDIENKLVGFTGGQVLEIIAESFNNGDYE